jgi:hypothetical protein
MDPTLIWDDESAINFLRYLDACLARKLDMGLSISISQQCFERLIERFRLNRQLLTTGEPVVTDIDELHRVGDELLLLVQIFTNYVIFESTHLEHSTRLVGAEALMMEALEFLMITVHQEGGDPDMHLRGSGIKVHLMKLIAYLLYRHPGNQRVAKQRGAIALVRQQLTYETANPCKYYIYSVSFHRAEK